MIKCEMKFTFYKKHSEMISKLRWKKEMIQQIITEGISFESQKGDQFCFVLKERVVLYMYICGYFFIIKK